MMHARVAFNCNLKINPMVKPKWLCVKCGLQCFRMQRALKRVLKACRTSAESSLPSIVSPSLSFPPHLWVGGTVGTFTSVQRANRPRSRSSLEEELGDAKSWISGLGVSFLQWSLVVTTPASKEVLGILSLLGLCQDRGCWGKQGCLLLWDLNLTSTFSKRLPVFILELCSSHACHEHYVQTQVKMT